MKINIFNSLRSKLIFWFLTVSLVPLITVGLLVYTQAQKVLETEVTNKLLAVRDIKAYQVEKYFSDRLNDIEMLSINPFTITALSAFKEAITTTVETQDISEIEVMNPYRTLYIGKPNLAKTDDSLYSTVHAQYHRTFKKYLETHGYYDIFLVEPHYGNIIYTVSKEDDFGTSLINGPYANTNIGEIFRQMTTTQPNATLLKDFAYYQPSKEPASFIASPIFDGPSLVGVLIFQLSIDQINAIMQQRTGLGETGETLLISSEDFLLRSDSRFFKNTTLLKQKVYTEATRASAVGETGVKMAIDYRDELTIIAHTPLNIPNVHWSLNAKIDKAEAFKAIHQMLILVLIIIGIGILVVIGMALFVGNSIAKPVEKITDIVRNLAIGNLNQAVEIKSQDEINTMAKAFQWMIANQSRVIEDIVQVSQGLANGNLRITPQAEYRGDFVQIKNALMMALSNQQLLIEDIVKVSQGLANGNLRVISQAEYKGDFVQIKTAKEVAFSDLRHVIEDIVQVSQGLAEGNLHVLPKGEYQGDFIQIKNALETTLFDLRQVVGDIVQVTKGLAEGRLDVLPTGEYRGDFLQIKNALETATIKLTEITTKNATQDWLKTGQAELNEKIRGEQEPIVLAQSILNYLAVYLNAEVGVFYLAEGERLKLVSSYAYKQRNNNDNEFKLGEGIIGQAALEKKSILFSQVPKENINLSINSGMGESFPHDIFVLPLLYEDHVLGVLELATVRHFSTTDIELLEQIADNIAISLHAAQSRLRTQALLIESQKLTDNLQTQQEELIESEERIRAIVDVAMDAIITIDEAGIIESINPAAEQFFDYAWSEVVGQNVKMLMPEPNHSQHDQYIKNYLTTGEAKMIGTRRETLGKRRDGSTFPIDLAVSEMTLGDKRLFNGIIRDITERKESDEALQMQQEELRAANEELQAQQEELAANNEELHAQQEELRVINTELEQKTKDLEKSKQTLEKKARALELSNQYKSEFLANVSHELRTPLNSLLILAQLLTHNKEGNLNDKQVEYAKTIHSAGYDLLTLINDILDLSKVEAGKMEIHPENISLSDLMEAIEQKFRHVAEDKDLSFAIKLADDVPDLLFTDIQRLKQIINNLLSNAFKFTTKGKVKLEIKKTDNQAVKNSDIQKTEYSDFLAISVTDSGIGIPKEKQDIIFEVFQQADGTTSRSYGGTGLGLSISRQLAKLLGGVLKLSVSEKDKGSTFTLFLPEILKKEVQESEVKDQKSIVEISSKKETLPSTKEVPESEETTEEIDVLDEDEQRREHDKEAILAYKKILIVDDDIRNTFALVTTLEDKDMDVIVGNTGKEGLDLLEKNPGVDMVLMDVMMPEMDGYEAMRKIRAQSRFRNLPIIALTAKAMKGDKAKCIEAGANDYLTKPVDADKLISLMRVWLY